MGRPKNKGTRVNLLKGLKVGDTLVLPPEVSKTAMLMTARNRYYKPAIALGIRISLSLDEQNNIQIKRES